MKEGMKKLMGLGGFALLVALGACQASASFITILDEQGSVYNLNTSSGVASYINTFQDPQSSQSQFSPNALGTSGGKYFYATFNHTGNELVFRNNDQILSVATANDAIAAGDAVGNNYYYVDRNGNFVTIGNIFGTASSVSSVNLFGGTTLGDLAINGNTGYLSYGSSLSVFDLTDPDHFTTVTGEQRYVGLGFASDGLYGVLRAGLGNFDLYKIDGSLNGSKVADITGIRGSNLEITDAARAIPDGGMTVLMLGAGLSVLGALRRKLS
jgi:hypothetical protein